MSILFIFVLDGYKSFFRSSGILNILGSSRILSLLIFCFLIFFFVLSKAEVYIVSLQVASMQFFTILFYFLFFRVSVYVYLSNKPVTGTIPTIIYGAGQAGRETTAALSQTKKYRILGFIDDDRRLKNFQIMGIKVLGNLNKITKLKKDYPNLLIIMAIQNISSFDRQRIISLIEPLEVTVKTIPSSYGGLETRLSIENINLGDLIERESTGLGKNTKYEKNIEDKNILITGAGGSIGSELSKQISELNPSKIVFLDSSEYNLYNLSQRLKNLKRIDSCEFILKSIQDKDDLESIIESESIDSIFHAAAYKHVPLLENSVNLKSALENNFFSTFDLCEIAYKHKVKNFTLISTDKAVNPTNIMGASKRLAELSLQGFQDLKDNNTCFSMVRFGNVLNSSGSVVPLFWDQISSGGPVTVTHKEINRFFMTIEEASSLVIKSSSISTGGEVFLLDMGSPIKIKDLAERMIRLSGNSVASEGKENGIKIVYSGLRPGEKLFEELLLSKNPIETEHPKIKKGLEKKFDMEEIYDLKIKINQLLERKDHELIHKEIQKYVDGF
ncbi:MAG: polysaccharide biosynthesis protein [Gammaproteobacteria bacterium]